MLAVTKRVFSWALARRTVLQPRTMRAPFALGSAATADRKSEASVSTLALTGMSSSLIPLAGISGAVAVGLGAYGAHTLSKKEGIVPERKTAFETASRYHFFHTMLLAVSPLASFPMLTGALATTGMVLFCGSCYVYAIQGREDVRRVTPAGGIILILAWLSLIL